MLWGFFLIRQIDGEQAFISTLLPYALFSHLTSDKVNLYAIY